MAEEKSIEERLAELERLVEQQRVEIENYRNEKGALRKALKEKEEEVKKIQEATLSEAERLQKEAARAKELEQALRQKEAEAIRLKILASEPHGLDPVFARLVVGESEEEVRASIEQLKQEQQALIDRLAPKAPQPPASTTPPPQGAPTPLAITPEDLKRMSPQEFAEFQARVKKGEVV